MASVLRYLTGHSDHHVDITDFISYKKNGRVGFPREPTCSGYDMALGLYYMGTREGHVHAIGGGNVHYIASLPDDKTTSKRYPLRIHAVPGIGHAMIVTNDYKVFRFRIEGPNTAFDAVDLGDFNRAITSTELLLHTATSNPRLLLGTPVGTVSAVDATNLTIEEMIPYVSAACETRETSLNNKVQTQAIATHSNGKHIAILYSDHRILIHDASINETMTMIDLGDVKPTTIAFGSNDVLLIPFEDGTYRELPQLHGDLSKPMQVFGPYPCNPVEKMMYAICGPTCVPVLAFTGGMPTASYGDHNTITLSTENGSLLCLDFSSKVLDFHVSRAPLAVNDDGGYYDSVLIALTEHEIVMVDLRDPLWRTLPATQYIPMDAHALTSSFYAANIAPEVWSKMLSLSESWVQKQNLSNAPNPFFAYTMDKADRSATDEHHKRQLLLTGHEDGTVNVFTCGEKSSRLLFTVPVHQEFELQRERERSTSITESVTNTLSSLEDLDYNEPGSGVLNRLNEEEWPPFRKVGMYDQYMDEPGVAVLKIFMDPNSGQFVVSTKCGVNLIFELCEKTKVLTPGLQSINLIEDAALRPVRPANDPLNRRDPDRPLPPRSKERVYQPGYHPCHVQDTTTSLFIQLDPRTPCTTMALLSSRNMVALASEFGFVILNYAIADIVLKNSYISSEDLMSAVGENMRSLYKSMKKSVRKTFRRKTRNSPKKEGALNDTANDGICVADEDAEDDGDFRPIERQIEARNTTCPIKAKPHLVRTVCFLRTPLTDGSDLTDTFWVGLNSGHIFSYAIEERPRQEDTLRLDKEIRLAHGAPVIHLGVFMEISNKVEEIYEAYDMDTLLCFPGSISKYKHMLAKKGGIEFVHALHRLLIVTEEQIRLYSLPSMKQLKYKVKITSTEGLHIKKVGVAVVHSATKPLTRAPWIVILTNTGEIRIYSTQNVKMKYRYQVIHQHNHIAISSTLLSPFGDLLYLRGQQTEFQKATISAHSVKWREPFADTKWPLFEDNEEDEIQLA